MVRDKIAALSVLLLFLLIDKCRGMLSVLPNSFEYTLSQGEYKVGFIHIHNIGNEISSVRLGTSGFARDWFFFSMPQFELLPGENASVRFIINVPKDVPEGEYSASIVVNEVSGNMTSVYTRSVWLYVQKYRYKIWDNWIEVNKGIKFGDFVMYITDVSQYTSSCMVNVTKNNRVIFSGPVSSQKREVDNISFYITSSYLGETMKGCWVVVEAEEEMSASLIDMAPTVSGPVIKIIGTPKAGRSIVIETSSEGKLIPGTIIIQTESETITLDSYTGLVTWKIPSNYTGPITILFYHGGKQLDYKVFTVEGTAVEEMVKPTLKIFCPETVLPNETITCQAINYDTGRPVGGILIMLEFMGGTSRPKWTSETTGEVSFQPPSDGWREGSITVIPKASGYNLLENSTVIQVILPRRKVTFVVSGEVFANEQFTIMAVDPKTGEIIEDYNENVVARIDNKTVTIRFRNGMANFTTERNGTLTLTAMRTDSFFEATSSFYILPERSLSILDVLTANAVPIGAGIICIAGITLMVRRRRRAPIVWERVEEEAKYPVKPIGK